jgi:GH43 family beta-xylosidase
MSLLPPLEQRFKKPLLDFGADPHVSLYGDKFYYPYAVNHIDRLFPADAGPHIKSILYLKIADSLDSIADAEAIEIWKRPAGTDCSENLWAPELHVLDGKWYVYLASGAYDGITQPGWPNQMSWVLEADNPRGPYKLKGQLETGTWAIDATILDLNGSRYCIWSGRHRIDSADQALYISKMESPWVLTGPIVKIAEPEFGWEKHGLEVNEGPQVVIRHNIVHVFYSASWSRTAYYCMGQLTLKGDDPLQAANWFKQPMPIYKSHGKIIAPGHASFIQTPDQSGGWMVYHAVNRNNAGWDRHVRLAAFKWAKEEHLKFVQTSRAFELAALKTKTPQLFRYRRKT